MGVRVVVPTRRARPGIRTLKLASNAAL